MVFGGRAVNPEARLSGPTHPKRGVREGGAGGKPKVRGQTTRDKKGELARQADKENRARVQGHIPRRKGVRTVQNGLVGIDVLTACIGREKGDKY